VIRTKDLLNFKAKELFELVINIEDYPNFLPYCKKSTIISEEENLIIADLTIGNFLFCEKFRSNVKTEKYKKIEIESIGKMIKALNAIWLFEDNEAGCNVTFEIKIQMKSAWMQKTLEKIFNDFFEKIIKSFEKRALEVKAES
jgi:coenzyme Q-binding protein COQ10